VETDKAVVEVPAPRSGRIARLHGAPGDILAVGAPLVEFALEGKPESETVVGEIPKAEARPSAPAQPPRAAAAPAVRASPAARNLARRLGVRLTDVRGSGPQGTITLEDVEAAAGQGGEAAAAEPLRGVRRAMALKMAEAHVEVVPASVTDDADVGAWGPGEDITLRLVRAIVRACDAAPALNAWYLGPDRGRILHDHVDLGIAMDTEDGLFVPGLRDVGAREPTDVRRGIEAMRADVGARKVPLKELRGQTITVSNFGMFGGRHAALVVLPPQVAIVGAGRLHEAVVPREGRPVVTRLLPLSLTFDHRAVMGGEAARFLVALVGDLERPA
jgi:pyruvate dehydrogenase E2 component (dihydrolipoamide acetyltransferase)